MDDNKNKVQNPVGPGLDSQSLFCGSQMDATRKKIQSPVGQNLDSQSLDQTGSTRKKVQSPAGHGLDSQSLFCGGQMDATRKKIQSPVAHSLDSQSEPAKPAAKAPQFRKGRGAKTDRNQRPNQISESEPYKSAGKLVGKAFIAGEDCARGRAVAMSRWKCRRHYCVFSGRGADA
ncbi:hypothetical protein O988_04859 [Pseudogymnoascus sp. VKM F-3808]|nr:hypothetical protein O988_04859 [Pseudogymnoascus sp. VKM F-3808]